MPSDPADGTARPLLDAIRERIGSNGPMPLDAYMRVCMQHPEHGYWFRAATVGAAGDFITAPEISQVFGELIGLWAAVTWERMGSPSPAQLVELGPGRGTLMRDALRAAQAMPAFVSAANVQMVELSEPLRAIQQQTLGAHHHGIGWHARLTDVPPGAAIIIGNEFIDALPIRQFIYRDRNWHERVVELAPDGTLRFGISPAVQVRINGAPQNGTVVEMRPEEDDVLDAIAARASPHVSLFIDYGPAEPTFGDTLQAVQRHAYVDPLAAPGAADLTSHVQFGVLARKARARGLTVHGPITQAEFLGRLGIVERTQRLMAGNPAKSADIDAAIQRLMSPTGMGGLFKVLAMTSPALPPPPAFG